MEAFIDLAIITLAGCLLILFMGLLEYLAKRFDL